ncbi:MAG: ATP-binding protein [Deltaproteobacteria bacterium]|nr:ATP-binding protein [Deltaproteobacteria bacterium]MBW2256679.1 ATP-binding protein [Deltaproteobacteria bacterium]
MRIAVLSGKGGTGKTTLVATFAHLADRVVAVECDVDAANLALVLPGEDGPAQPFLSGRKAVVDEAVCAGCGSCAEVCRFDALQPTPHGAFRVVVPACEGCGACAFVCPMGAISYADNLAGTWRIRRIARGWLVHASLGVAQDNSGKLVAHVREQARQLAEAHGVDLVLADGPPGMGCPVLATVGHQDRVLAVTEPTASGARDLNRLLDLGHHFRIPVDVVVNKWDLSPAGTNTIEEACAERRVPVIGRIPFDPAVPRMLARGEVPLGPPAHFATRAALRAVWARVSRQVTLATAVG